MNIVLYVIIAVLAVFLVYRMMPAKGVKSLSPDDLKDLLATKKDEVQFVDVRESREFKAGHVTGFKNIPLSNFNKHLVELKKDQPVVVMCHSGARSMQASRILRKNGFTDVRNLSGGIMKWKAHQ